MGITYVVAFPKMGKPSLPHSYGKRSMKKGDSTNFMPFSFSRDSTSATGSSMVWSPLYIFPLEFLFFKSLTLPLFIFLSLSFTLHYNKKHFFFPQNISFHSKKTTKMQFKEIMKYRGRNSCSNQSTGSVCMLYVWC